MEIKPTPWNLKILNILLFPFKPLEFLFKPKEIIIKDLKNFLLPSVIIQGLVLALVLFGIFSSILHERQQRKDAMTNESTADKVIDNRGISVEDSILLSELLKSPDIPDSLKNTANRMFEDQVNKQKPTKKFNLKDELLGILFVLGTLGLTFTGALLGYLRLYPYPNYMYTREIQGFSLAGNLGNILFPIVRATFIILYFLAGLNLIVLIILAISVIVASFISIFYIIGWGLLIVLTLGMILFSDNYHFKGVLEPIWKIALLPTEIFKFEEKVLSWLGVPVEAFVGGSILLLLIIPMLIGFYIRWKLPYYEQL